MQDTINSINERVAEAHDDIVTFLRDIVAIPSMDSDIEAVGQRIGEEMRKLGFDEVYVDRYGSIVGRIGSGVAELIAALLLLVPRTAWMGAALALGIMSGAILSHLTVLGIEVMGDGGTLFALAIAVAVCAAFVLVRDHDRAITLLRSLRQRAV